MGNCTPDVLKPEADTLSTNWPKATFVLHGMATCFLSRCRTEEKDTKTVKVQSQRQKNKCAVYAIPNDMKYELQDEHFP